MRLDFTVLWIDDQQKHVASFSEGLRLQLLEKGFDLEVIPIESLENIQGVVGSHVHVDSIDLVLVDYDLGSGAGGDQALVNIRRHFPFKEVIFYSASDTEKLRKIAFDSKIDGVYFSTRLSLVSDTAQVIDKLLHKVLDLDHMRGVVMSASSDIDFLVERSLHAVYERLDQPGKERFKQALQEKISKKLRNWAKDLEKACAESGVQCVFEDLRAVYTAHDKLGTLLDELNAGWAADGSTHLARVKEYRENIVPRRNRLAHAMLKRDRGQAPIMVGEGAVPSADDMTDLRRSLIEHRENFKNIAVLVDATF